jgi:hypothetical protein
MDKDAGFALLVKSGKKRSAAEGEKNLKPPEVSSFP